jgi:Bacterial conjugation TrbI-like protein/Phage integrase family
MRHLYSIDNEAHTAYNRIGIVQQWLKLNRITGLLHGRDKPSFVTNMREMYQPEDLEALFRSCNPEERIRYLFFLLTGERDKEVRYTSWSDIDFNRKCVRVTAKKQLGFKPKDKEEREIPVPASLLDALREYKARQTGFNRNDLVFPTSQRRPDRKLENKLKRIAWRAGLNCGLCTSKYGNKCNEGAGTRSDLQSVSNLGLAPGYHVAARLESMATTAVHAPVTAVVEYNYERDGEVLIPEGSRIVGKISQADPSGLVNITFSSIEFPGGETVPIDAVAADMSLQAIKGKVTGKQAGKSMLVRSLSGIGETAAMIVGAPSANGAFGEDDLLRVRMADNIGNASDQEIMQMMTMQHIVVSVPAGTEIYVIFEKSQQPDAAGTEKTVHVPHLENTALDSSTPVQP